MKVRTIIVADPVSDDFDGEVDSIVMQLKDLVGLDLDVVAIANGMHDVRRRNADLLVIDYGGIAWGGASGTANAQIYAALQWAEEHPGALVIIWTWHTRDIYERELKQEFGDLDNVIMRYGDSMFDDRWDDVEKRLRDYFGFSLPSMEPIELKTPGRPSK
jgi:hypothetical protein